MAGYIYLGSRYVGYCGGGTSNLFAGGLMVAPGQLYHMAGSGTGPSSYAIDDTWNSHNTYGSSLFTAGSHNTGISTSYASSYFTVSDLTSIQIPTGQISYGGYSDWRIPTKNEWDLIFFGGTADIMSPVSRPKATVNNAERYRADIVVTDNTFAGSTTYGSLLFPDGGTFTGVNVAPGMGTAARLTKAQVEAYIAQGAVFMMMTGSYTYWHQNTNYYWIPPSTNTYIDRFGSYGYIFGAAYSSEPYGSPTGVGIGESSWWQNDNGGSVFNYYTGWGSTYQGGTNYAVGAPITLIRGQIDL